MWQFTLDLMFPRHSLSRSGSTWVSDEERAVLQACQPVLLHTDKLRSIGVMHLDMLAAGASYHASPFLKTAIQRYKYQRVSALKEDLAALILRAYPLLQFPPETVITWVPLHWSRKFWRGFDQSEELAQCLAEDAGLPVERLLKRIRPTGHQAWRSGTERRAAMHGAFMFVNKNVPEHVLLVDDVATTMSTLDACAHALKNAGVSHVDAVTIALG